MHNYERQLIKNWRLQCNKILSRPPGSHESHQPAFVFSACAFELEKRALKFDRRKMRRIQKIRETHKKEE